MNVENRLCKVNNGNKLKVKYFPLTCQRVIVYKVQEGCMARAKTTPVVSTYITLKRNKASTKYEARVIDKRTKDESRCVGANAVDAVLCARKKTL